MSLPGTRHGLVAGLLALLAWAAVGLQLVLSIRLGLANSGSALAGLVAFLGYFTVLTNLFVALVATSLLRAGATGNPGWLAHPWSVGCATTSIVLVGLVYHLVLRGLWAPEGAQWLADVMLHYLVPALAVVHWLMFRPTVRPGWRAPLAWTAYPMAYLAYALARGHVLSTYPYPFIDVGALGYGTVMLTAGALLLVFIALGYGVLILGRFNPGAARAFSRRST